MRNGLVTLLLLLGAAAVACTARDAETAGGLSPTSPTSSGGAAQPSEEASPPSPRETRQQIRAMLRDPAPEVDDVVALSGGPTGWIVGRQGMVIEHAVTYPVNWPFDTGAVVAVQVVDKSGRVLGEWVDLDSRREVRTYWPAGADFVGLPHRGRKALLVRDGAPVPLTVVPGSRAAAGSDVRFGPGWLLDSATRTVTRERVPGCRPDSVRVDLRARIWCLDPRKSNLAWSDDGGRRWDRRQLSTSYFAWCDGGTLGSDLEVLGDVVAIGLWRADFSLDRGRTWADVSLPWRLAAGFQGGTAADCTRVEPLADGRLVMSYFSAAVATDPTNTSFHPLRTPHDTMFTDVQEGVLEAASNRPFAERFVSFDGGTTWHHPQVDDLVRNLLGGT